MSKQDNKDKHHVHHGYDHALKLLFSHPIMMESLIKGFVPHLWAKNLDFSSLRAVNVKKITEDLREREDDLIWAIELKGQPLYIICLLEFQSEIERFMAVRILTYVGLIYQDLLKQNKIENKHLPPVFSLVFYTGSRPWNAPTILKNCLSPLIPEGLRKYQPNIEYMVLDVGQISFEEYNLTDNNLVTSLIELERVSDLTNLKKVVDTLSKRLKSKQLRNVRKSFVVYINRVWKARKRFPGKTFEDLDEVSNMLSERIDQWEQEWLQQGHQQGLQQGAYEVLLKLLDHKFPMAPASLKEKFEKTSSDELKLILDKILKAQVLEELLEAVEVEN